MNEQVESSKQNKREFEPLPVRTQDQHVCVCDNTREEDETTQGEPPLPSAAPLS